jgi:hypothetical protein
VMEVFAKSGTVSAIACVPTRWRALLGGVFTNTVRSETVTPAL